MEFRAFGGAHGHWDKGDPADKGLAFPKEFCKAFHQIEKIKSILKKWSCHGMRGKIFTWIKNCWKQRNHRLGINLSMFTGWKWLEFTKGMKFGKNVGNPCDNKRQETHPGAGSCSHWEVLLLSPPPFFSVKKVGQDLNQTERKGQQMGLNWFTNMWGFIPETVTNTRILHPENVWIREGRVGMDLYKPTPWRELQAQKKLG